MDCPVCNKPLIVVESNKIELDYCIFCKGLWFDQSEIDLLISNLSLGFSTNDISICPTISADNKYKCPKCDTEMRKIKYGPVILDRCLNEHGLWFDAGELGQLISQYAHFSNSQEAPVIQFLGEIFNSQKENEINS